MDLVLVSDETGDEGRRMVVEARGANAVSASAVLTEIRRNLAPTVGHNVDGASENREDGTVRWAFTFSDEDDSGLAADDSPPGAHNGSDWTMTFDEGSDTTPH